MNVLDGHFIGEINLNVTRQIEVIVINKLSFTLNLYYSDTYSIVVYRLSFMLSSFLPHVYVYVCIKSHSLDKTFYWTYTSEIMQWYGQTKSINSSCNEKCYNDIDTSIPWNIQYMGTSMIYEFIFNPANCTVLIIISSILPCINPLRTQNTFRFTDD